jgi:hypothetical protein
MARKSTSPRPTRKPPQRKGAAASKDAQAEKRAKAAERDDDARDTQPAPASSQTSGDRDSTAGSPEQRSSTEPASVASGEARREVGKPLPLSEYVAILRREIARASAMSATDDDLPVVAVAEAELTFSYVVISIDGERIYIDASSAALSAAPAAAVQRMRLKLIDTEIALELQDKS